MQEMTADSSCLPSTEMGIILRNGGHGDPGTRHLWISPPEGEYDPMKPKPDSMLIDSHAENPESMRQLADQFRDLIGEYTLDGYGFCRCFTRGL